MAVESYDKLIDLVQDRQFGYMDEYIKDNGKIMDEINRLLKNEAPGWRWR